MINITDRAKEELIGALAEESATMVRFGLKGGGCSGFSYFFEITAEQQEDDFVFPLNDTCILLVDAASGMYLGGATIDFKDDLMGSSFVFENPNAATTCGCGSSFSP